MTLESSNGTKNRKTPPLRQNPQVFEIAFEERLGQSPVNYLIGKIQSGSSTSTIEDLFEIISAEIAMKNKCLCKGFDYYHTMAKEKMKEMKKLIVYNKLVRDNIPEIIEASGKTRVIEVLPNDAYGLAGRWVKHLLLSRNAKCL